MTPCPSCHRPPQVIGGKLQDSHEPWANVFCPPCWDPRRPLEGVAQGKSREEATAEWNRMQGDTVRRYAPYKDKGRTTVAEAPVGYCRKCDRPRPRQRGRTLCWHCQDPKKRSSRQPESLTGTGIDTRATNTA